MPAKLTIKRTGSRTGSIEKAVAQLARTRLRVGIPGDSSPRPVEPGQKGTPPSNALVGYVLETGDPSRNLPARPFLAPGVDDARAEVVRGMEKAAIAALSGRPGGIADGLDQAGLAAVASVKAKMQAGPFAPLSDRTIEARARRRYGDTGRLKGDKAGRDARAFLVLRGQGTPDAVLHDAGLAQPLIDTRSLITSITYAIKER